jgi:hypothetical protein
LKNKTQQKFCNRLGRKKCQGLGLGFEPIIKENCKGGVLRSKKGKKGGEGKMERSLHRA